MDMAITMDAANENQDLFAGVRWILGEMPTD